MSIGFGTDLPVRYEEAIPLVKSALKDQGFGVLTEIDVRSTLNVKLGVDTSPYLILGACNPQLAHRALQTDPEIGLFLPCNVTVRETESGSRVDIVDPNAMLAVSDKPALADIASEARARLNTALKTIEAAARPDAAC